MSRIRIHPNDENISDDSDCDESITSEWKPVDELLLISQVTSQLDADNIPYDQKLETLNWENINVRERVCDELKTQLKIIVERTRTFRLLKEILNDAESDILKTLGVVNKQGDRKIGKAYSKFLHSINKGNTKNTKSPGKRLDIITPFNLFFVTGSVGKHKAKRDYLALSKAEKLKWIYLAIEARFKSKLNAEEYIKATNMLSREEMKLLDECEGRPKFFTPYKLFIKDFYASYKKENNTSELYKYKGWGVASEAWKASTNETKQQYINKSAEINKESEKAYDSFIKTLPADRKELEMNKKYQLNTSLSKAKRNRVKREDHSFFSDEANTKDNNSCTDEEEDYHLNTSKKHDSKSEDHETSDNNRTCKLNRKNDALNKTSIEFKATNGKDKNLDKKNFAALKQNEKLKWIYKAIGEELNSETNESKFQKAKQILSQNGMYMLRKQKGGPPMIKKIKQSNERNTSKDLVADKNKTTNTNVTSMEQTKSDQRDQDLNELDFSDIVEGLDEFFNDLEMEITDAPSKVEIVEERNNSPIESRNSSCSVHLSNEDNIDTNFQAMNENSTLYVAVDDEKLKNQINIKPRSSPLKNKENEKSFNKTKNINKSSQLSPVIVEDNEEHIFIQKKRKLSTSDDSSDSEVINVRNESIREEKQMLNFKRCQKDCSTPVTMTQKAISPLQSKENEKQENENEEDCSLNKLTQTKGTNKKKKKNLETTHSPSISKNNKQILNSKKQIRTATTPNDADDSNIIITKHKNQQENVRSNKAESVLKDCSTLGLKKENNDAIEQKRKSEGDIKNTKTEDILLSNEKLTPKQKTTKRTAYLSLNRSRGKNFNKVKNAENSPRVSRSPDLFEKEENVMFLQSNRNTNFTKNNSIEKDNKITENSDDNLTIVLQQKEKSSIEKQEKHNESYQTREQDQSNDKIELVTNKSGHLINDIRNEIPTQQSIQTIAINDEDSIFLKTQDDNKLSTTKLKDLSSNAISCESSSESICSVSDCDTVKCNKKTNLDSVSIDLTQEEDKAILRTKRRKLRELLLRSSANLTSSKNISSTENNTYKLRVPNAEELKETLAKTIGSMNESKMLSLAVPSSLTGNKDKIEPNYLSSEEFPNVNIHSTIIIELSDNLRNYQVIPKENSAESSCSASMSLMQRSIDSSFLQFQHQRPPHSPFSYFYRKVCRKYSKYEAKEKYKALSDRKRKAIYDKYKYHRDCYLKNFEGFLKNLTYEELKEYARRRACGKLE